MTQLRNVQTCIGLLLLSVLAPVLLEAISGDHQIGSPQLESMKKWKTKDGYPIDIKNAFNIARRKKAFALVIFHKVVKVNVSERSTSHRQKQSSGGQFNRRSSPATKRNTHKYGGDGQGDIRLGRSKASGETLKTTISNFAGAHHIKILSKKMYIKNSKIEKVRDYKFCRNPSGPYGVLITPTGEIAGEVSATHDTVMFYNHTTRFMYEWCKKEHLAGNIQNAYWGIVSLEKVSRAYKHKDKLKELKAKILEDYDIFQEEQKAGKQAKEPVKAEVVPQDDAADEAVDEAVSDDPNDPKWRKAKSTLNMAKQLEDNEDSALALKYYQKILEGYPNSPQATDARKAIERLLED